MSDVENSYDILKKNNETLKNSTIYLGIFLCHLYAQHVKVLEIILKVQIADTPFDMTYMRSTTKTMYTTSRRCQIPDLQDCCCRF